MIGFLVCTLLQHHVDCEILGVSLQTAAAAVISMMVDSQMLQIPRQGRMQAAGCPKMFIIMMAERLCQSHPVVTEYLSLQ